MTDRDARQQAHLNLLAAVADVMERAFPEAHDFLPEPLPGADAWHDETPVALPMLPELPALADLAAPATRAAVDALIAAAPHLAWRQSYSAREGFGRDYLDHYGWINLVSPEGPFLSDVSRVTIGYWGRGLRYPRHAHAPEEIYCVLAGEALFRSEGEAPRRVGPGGMVRHASMQPHAIDMEPGPLLALVPWRGDGLMRISTFPGRDG